MAVPRAREALSQTGGAIDSAGDPALAPKLAAALAASDGAGKDDLTHGFHTYPARMHPQLARELIALGARSGDLIVDPFCGAGTVLIEALVAGCRAIGVDLNPLALRIAEVQCALHDAAACARFERSLEAVANASLARVQGRVRPKFSLPQAARESYEPHVLLELSGLYDEISLVHEHDDRHGLTMVFSALLVKFSRRRADTSDEHVDKRIRKGLVSEFFLRKGRELSLRWQALFETAPAGARAALLYCADARDLRERLGPRTRADLILTSPPYGGTYDYAKHHELRNAWFDLAPGAWQANEIGARRRLSRGREAGERWDEELSATLRAASGVLSPRGRLILWLGDAELSGRRVTALEQVTRLAPAARLTLIASATQSKRDARGGPPRGEHVLWLEPMPD